MKISVLDAPSAYGRFHKRRNRFVVELEIDGTATTASLPNPGRMQELLLPGVELGVVPGPAGGRHPWKVRSLRTRDATVPLDTGAGNQVAARLIDGGMVPGLEGWRVLRSEVVPPGLHSRFDFLLCRRDDPRSQRYLEVKSCTLFNGEWAFFPDAVSDRARRHVEELVSAGASTGVPGVVLVLVHSSAVRFFSPDVHVDLAFSRTLAEHRDALELIPLGLCWDAQLSLAAAPRRLRVPWERILPALDDRGSYLILLELPHPRRITVGALGTRDFPAGFYVYVGSAQRGLSRRIARHRRKRGSSLHWHVDYLRREASVVDSWAIREPYRREEEIAGAVAALAERSEPNFGSSDSSRESHLFYWSTDPRRNRSFQELILELRRFGFTAPRSPGPPPKRSPEFD